MSIGQQPTSKYQAGIQPKHPNIGNQTQDNNNLVVLRNHHLIPLQQQI
tara:strand:+ start:467 stop:610 length:144 start_codon:yes stop_codon:yes gene_type:complete